MINVMPFLLFDGNCAEAMKFYQSCLGGDLTITKAADTPMREQVPPEHHQKVVNAHLKNHAVELMASDWLHPARTPKQGNMVCVYLSGGTYSELREVFDKLAVGADKALLDDLRDMPFGTYGHLADRYGVHWFFGARTRLVSPWCIQAPSLLEAHQLSDSATKSPSQPKTSTPLATGFDIAAWRFATTNHRGMLFAPARTPQSSRPPGCSTDEANFV